MRNELTGMQICKFSISSGANFSYNLGTPKRHGWLEKAESRELLGVQAVVLFPNGNMPFRFLFDWVPIGNREHGNMAELGNTLGTWEQFFRVVKQSI